MYAATSSDTNTPATSRCIRTRSSGVVTAPIASNGMSSPTRRSIVSSSPGVG